MPVPKTTKTAETETVTVADPSTTLNDLGGANANANANAVQTTPLDSTEAASLTSDTSGTSDASSAPKPRRGRKAGAPTAPPFDQQMYWAMRAQANKLASQQVAAGLPENIDAGKLLEAVKGLQGFEGVDLNRLKSKYKAALKELVESPKWEEISGGGLSHPLYLPPLSESRAKINVFAIEE